MKSKEEITQTNSPTRRKFAVGIGILSLYTAASAIFRSPFSIKKNITVCKPDIKKKTIKMLTQDGRLVEVDEALLTASRKKVTDIELQNWIKK
jgi:hypothetical protein